LSYPRRKQKGEKKDYVGFEAFTVVTEERHVPEDGVLRRKDRSFKRL
jgi:hypothetical protein